jgi:hypothetical protein
MPQQRIFYLGYSLVHLPLIKLRGDGVNPACVFTTKILARLTPVFRVPIRRVFFEENPLSQLELI